MFKGSIVALITPFRDNKVDEDCFISSSTNGFGNGKIRSAAIDFEQKIMLKANKITLSLLKFLINL